MNRDRFLEIVEAYGAEPRRWPAHERAAALAYREADSEAAAVFTQAAALDAVLDESRPIAPSAALRGRVAAGAPRPRRAPPRLGWWAPGAGLVAAGVAGLMFGAALLAPPEPQTETLLAESEAYDLLEVLEPVEGQL